MVNKKVSINVAPLTLWDVKVTVEDSVGRGKPPALEVPTCHEIPENL
jgi:hypothetical protein